MQFEINKQLLINGDWRGHVKRLPESSVDLLLADPPYGNTGIPWDKPIDLEEFWSEMNRVCKPSALMIVFGCGKFVPRLLNSNLKNFRYELVWEKTLAQGFLSANKRPLRAHEQILIFCRELGRSTYNPQKIVGKVHKNGGLREKPIHYQGINRKTEEIQTNLYFPRSVLKYSNVVKGKSIHPTAKPLELIDWLVRSYSNPGDIVLDPFSGSGTTLAACLLSDRRGTGIEISKEYFKTSKKRLIEAEKARD